VRLRHRCTLEIELTTGSTSRTARSRTPSGGSTRSARRSTRSTPVRAKIERLKKGDELPPGVIKLVKVYVAIKRKLSGRRQDGRPPREQGRHLQDPPDRGHAVPGRRYPVDIVLNPLGVPSRMNVGQILETHLGWAGRGMGSKIGRHCSRSSTTRPSCGLPASASSRQPEVQPSSSRRRRCDLRAFARSTGTASPSRPRCSPAPAKRRSSDALKLAGFDDATVRPCSSTVAPARPFHQRVTVGVMYMLKLHHLVDDKIHARSIGPYSLVTQQPLGGKAQFGGQRLGEMEVWAMEAYGAAYGLQEFLTVKSDDVAGRTRMYESIVKGENVLEAVCPSRSTCSSRRCRPSPSTSSSSRTRKSSASDLSALHGAPAARIVWAQGPSFVPSFHPLFSRPPGHPPATGDHREGDLQPLTRSRRTR
jgi:DNA-directed RNA polymerase beta subunit